MIVEEEMIFEDNTPCVIYKVVNQEDKSSLTKVLAVCMHIEILQKIWGLLNSNEITQADIDAGVICYTTKASFADNSCKLN